MKRQIDFGTRSQDTYNAIIRKLDRMDMILSCTAAMVWSFAVTLLVLEMVDFLNR